MISKLKPKEINVWAVVVENRVIDIYFGHPDLYDTILPDNIKISLVECDRDTRGHADIGDIWNGYKFINMKNLKKVGEV